MSNVLQTLLERVVSAQRPIRHVVEVVLVAVLALVAARLVWLVIAPSDSVSRVPDRPLPSPFESSATAMGVGVDRSALIKANPFRGAVVDSFVVDAPQTNLNLTLEGLRMSTDAGTASMAIVRTPDGQGKTYTVGDDIMAGVRLQGIYADRILINRDGTDETLFLNGRSDGLSVIGDDVPAEAEAAAVADQATQPDPAPGRETTEDDTGRIADPVMLFSAIMATPSESADGQAGFTLNPRGNGELMRQAGLQPGDVLIEVNGTQVAGLDPNGLLAALEADGSARLTVERDGARRSVQVSFDQ